MVNNKFLKNMSSETKWKIGLAVLAFFVAFVNYALTMAPTVSFWDCGEFVACSHILGIPHPPGTPLFMVLGRTIILLFSFLGEEAERLNYISVTSSALMVAFVFLFTEKIINLVFSGKISNFAKNTGALVAALLVCFSDTIWFSAVEAEVYGVAMLTLMIISYLSLLWVENRKAPKAYRYLLLICYLAFLGVGFHLYTMMTLPAILLLMMMVDKESRTNWPLLLTGGALLSIIFSIADFPFIAAGTLLTSVCGWALSKTELYKRRWSFCLLFTIVAAIGYSSHLYIPIRSSLDPRIDENDPETWQAYSDFLERKQYGAENMLTRAFTRRGQLLNQLLTYPHMGYGGYMLAQYFPWKVGETREEDNDVVERLGGKLKFESQMKLLGENKGMQMFLFLLFQAPIFAAAWYAYKRNPAIGLYAFLLYVMGSYGLVFYMNFADGTMPEVRDQIEWAKSGKSPEQKPPPVHLEVRDRDYFFTPGFIFMGVMFGLAAGMLLRRMQQPGGPGQGLTRFAAVGLVVASSVIPCWSNFKEHNRSGMWVPWDYAYNLLMSCKPNSVLFTNGDNDTFPLWFMQEVENIRMDVRVVNLSLVNTNWYIRQLTEFDPVLKLGFSREEIDQLGPTMNRFKKPVGISLGKTGLSIQMEGQDKLPYFKVQDIMVINIVQNNYPERPIHFAVTVGDDNMMGLAKYVKMDGMVYTLTNKEHNKEVDVERTTYLVDSVYKYRGLGDNTTYLDGNTKGLLTNYSATNFRLVLWAQGRISNLDKEINQLQGTLQGESSQGSKDSVSALIETKKSERLNAVTLGNKYIALNEKLLPDDWRNYYYAGQYYSFLKENDKAEAAFRGGFKNAPNPRIFGSQLGQFLVGEKKYAAAESVFLDLKTRFPQDFEFVYGLSEAYQAQNKKPEAKQLLGDWLKMNPSHQYAPMVRAQMEMMEVPKVPIEQAVPDATDRKNSQEIDSLVKDSAL